MYDGGSYWPTTDPGNIRKLGTRPALGIYVGERERDGGEQQGVVSSRGSEQPGRGSSRG